MNVDRQVRKIAEREAAECGLSFSWEHGSSHPILVLSRGDRRRSFTVSGSPRSRTNQRNWIRQDVRRIARELR